MTSSLLTTSRLSTTWASCSPAWERARLVGSCSHSTMREVLSELEQWSREGEDIALATVVETWGSSPRPLGSKMVVTRSGKMAGSVSNGCIEGAVFEEAQKVLKSGEPKLAAFGVADDLAFSVGLDCGGHIEVFIQALGPEHLRLIALLQRNAPATLRTNLVTGEGELVEGAPS